MKKLVIGFALLLSVPLVSMAEEATTVATPVPAAEQPAVTAPEQAKPDPAAEAVVAPAAEKPASLPSGYIPWKAPQGK